MKVFYLELTEFSFCQIRCEFRLLQYTRNFPNKLYMFFPTVITWENPHANRHDAVLIRTYGVTNADIRFALSVNRTPF